MKGIQEDKNRDNNTGITIGFIGEMFTVENGIVLLDSKVCENTRFYKEKDVKKTNMVYLKVYLNAACLVYALCNVCKSLTIMII